MIEGLGLELKVGSASVGNKQWEDKTRGRGRKVELAPADSSLRNV